jgi:hypothetical protein
MDWINFLLDTYQSTSIWTELKELVFFLSFIPFFFHERVCYYLDPWCWVPWVQRKGFFAEEPLHDQKFCQGMSPTIMPTTITQGPTKKYAWWSCWEPKDKIMVQFKLQRYWCVQKWGILFCCSEVENFVAWVRDSTLISLWMLLTK